MTDAAQTQVQTTAQIDQHHTTQIASNLQQVGHNVTAQDVVPITAETPVDKTPLMDALGVETVGEDIAHVVGTTVGDLTMGVQKTRITPSKRFLGKLLEKLNRKKKPNEIIVESK